MLIKRVCVKNLCHKNYSHSLCHKHSQGKFPCERQRLQQQPLLTVVVEDAVVVEREVLLGILKITGTVNFYNSFLRDCCRDAQGVGRDVKSTVKRKTTHNLTTCIIVIVLMSLLI